MLGLPIGASPSAVSVDFVLSHHETNFLDNHVQRLLEKFDSPTFPFEDLVAWHRYVDDVISASKCFCAPCLLSALHLTYPVSMSVSSGWWNQQDQPHIVTDALLVPNNESFLDRKSVV